MSNFMLNLIGDFLFWCGQHPIAFTVLLFVALFILALVR